MVLRTDYTNNELQVDAHVLAHNDANTETNRLTDLDQNALTPHLEPGWIVLPVTGDNAVRIGDSGGPILATFDGSTECRYRIKHGLAEFYLSGQLATGMTPVGAIYLDHGVELTRVDGSAATLGSWHGGIGGSGQTAGIMAYIDRFTVRIRDYLGQLVEDPLSPGEGFNCLWSYPVLEPDT